MCGRQFHDRNEPFFLIRRARSFELLACHHIVIRLLPAPTAPFAFPNRASHVGATRKTSYRGCHAPRDTARASPHNQCTTPVLSPTPGSATPRPAASNYPSACSFGATASGADLSAAF